MQPPFRNHLHGTADAETTELLALILDAHAQRVPLSNLVEIIDTANELVLWQLASLVRGQGSRWSNIGVFPEQRFASLLVIARLVARLIRDADAEGVVWTPVLDVLAESIGWHDVVAEKLSVDGVPIPSAEERAGLLAPWVSGVENPAELRDLLRFRAEAISMVVGRHAPAFDHGLLSSIRLTPKTGEQLAQNPALDPSSAYTLIERLYGLWKETLDETPNLTANTRDQLNHSYAGILVAFLRCGFSLPPAIRAEATDLVCTNSGLQRPDRAINFLLHDRTTPGEVLARLPFLLILRHASVAMAHPNCPVALWEELADKGQVLLSALQEQQLPADKVVLAYARAQQPNSKLACLLGVLQQEQSTPEMWLESIAKAIPTNRARILVALSFNPQARQHPEVRAALLKSTAVEVATNLLRDRRPEEFEPLMLRWLQRDSEAATTYLRQEGIPPGTPFPKKLTTELLNSEDAQERLLAITLLSDLKAAEGAPEILATSGTPKWSEILETRAAPRSRTSARRNG